MLVGNFTILCKWNFRTLHHLWQSLLNCVGYVVTWVTWVRVLCVSNFHVGLVGYVYQNVLYVSRHFYMSSVDRKYFEGHYFSLNRNFLGWVNFFAWINFSVFFAGACKDFSVVQFFLVWIKNVFPGSKIFWRSFLETFSLVTKSLFLCGCGML